MSRDRDTGNGVLAAWVGSMVGAAIGGIPAMVAGAAIGDATSSGFDEIATGVTNAVYGFAFGAWVGGSIGCALGLRLRSHGNAAATGIMLAVLLLTGGLLWVFVLIDMGDVLAIYVPLLGLVFAPIVARSLTGIDASP